jgi:hypothetical protein
MTAVGGSIESVSIRGRLFAVPADVDASVDLGGKTNEVQANGNGTARIIQTTKPWMTEGLSVEISQDRGDLEFLQEIADDGEFVPITLTLASGVTYGGEGIITGDIKGGTQSATGEITLSGPGKQEQQ